MQVDSVEFVIDIDYPIAGPTPVQGALVAFDAPGGERMEAVTDADGRVRFTGFDWARGEAAVTAFSDRASDQLQSLTGITPDVVEELREEDGAVHIPLVPVREEEATVEISGRLTSMVDEEHHTVVSTDVPGAWDSWQQGPAYALRVAPNRAFVMLANEYTFAEPELPGHVYAYDLTFFGWSRVEHAGTSTPEIVDIDMAQSLQTRTLTKVVHLPPEAADYDFDVSVGMYEASTFLSVGGPTRIRATTSSVTLDLEYVAVIPEAELLTTVSFNAPEFSSYVYAYGDPRDAFPSPQLPPIIVNDPRLEQRVEWEVQVEGPAWTAFGVWNAELRTYSHVISTLSWDPQPIPAPPGGLDPSAVYGDGATIVAQVCLVDDEDRFITCALGPPVPFRD